MTIFVRSADAEVLGGEAVSMRLFADHDTTGGTLSANSARMRHGANGAAPHYHTRSAEMFFMLEGSMQALAGDQVHTLEKGDFLLVPANTMHAFGASPGADAEVLIVFAPGLARFDYFRLIDRVQKGTASPQEILDTQDRFDNHFRDSPIWSEARKA